MLYNAAFKMVVTDLGAARSHVSKSQMLSAGILLFFSILSQSKSATSPLSICQFMDVAVMSAGLYTQCAVQCVNKREQRLRRQQHGS